VEISSTCRSKTLDFFTISISVSSFCCSSRAMFFKNRSEKRVIQILIHEKQIEELFIFTGILIMELRLDLLNKNKD
jgi:hypothetical protein